MFIVHESDWQNTFTLIKEFRRSLKNAYGVRQRDELRANDLIKGQGFSFRLKLDIEKRMDIYKRTMIFISQLPTIKTFSVCMRKDFLHRRDFAVFEFAWKILITRLHYALANLNQKSLVKDKGIIISDKSDEAKVRKILRQLRVYNPVKTSGAQYKNVIVDTVIEDPFFRESEHSHFVQLCDMTAFSVAGQEFLIKTLIPYNFSNFYSLLQPVVLQEVSKANKLGIVYFPNK